MIQNSSRVQRGLEDYNDCYQRFSMDSMIALSVKGTEIFVDEP